MILLSFVIHAEGQEGTDEDQRTSIRGADLEPTRKMLSNLKQHATYPVLYTFLSAPKGVAQLIRRAVTCVILLRVCGKFFPLRARYLILLDHAQDTENDIFQKLIWIRGRSAKTYIRSLKMSSPRFFGICKFLLHQQSKLALIAEMFVFLLCYYCFIMMAHSVFNYERWALRHRLSKSKDD